MIDEILYQIPGRPEKVSATKIRVAKPDDAAEVLGLINELMLDGKNYLSDSFRYSVNQESEWIKSAGKEQLLLVSEDESGLTGWISIQKNPAKFSRHIGTIIIGVKEDKQHTGIGSQLLKQMETQALFIGIEKIELTVRSSNEKAFHFYLKNGYIHEGRKHRSVKNKSIYDDEILLAKLLK